MDSQPWSRRANSGKLSLTTPGGANGNILNQSDSSKTIYSRRNGGDSSSSLTRPSITTPGGGLASPTGPASSAFGIGSGAFAGFGSKTPKTPGGNPFDISLGAAAAGAKAAAEKVAKDKSTTTPSSASKTGSVNRSTKDSSPFFKDTYSSSKSTAVPPLGSHKLGTKWVFWFRPPITKANGYIEYEKTLHPIARATTVEEFFCIYRHLKRPSELPAVSDYHLFKEGIRPIWEDDVNKQGGKWVVRLKKGVADRYWEELLLAMVGSQFECSDMSEVCGIVLSVRNGEDIISIWTEENGNRVRKIREIMKKVLNLPADTKVDWKSHDESIQQRVAVEESRREKAAAHHHGEKRGGPKSDTQRQQA